MTFKGRDIGPGNGLARKSFFIEDAVLQVTAKGVRLNPDQLLATLTTQTQETLCQECTRPPSKQPRTSGFPDFATPGLPVAGLGSCAIQRTLLVHQGRLEQERTGCQESGAAQRGGVARQAASRSQEARAGPSP